MQKKNFVHTHINGETHTHWKQQKSQKVDITVPMIISILQFNILGTSDATALWRSVECIIFCECASVVDLGVGSWTSGVLKDNFWALSLEGQVLVNNTCGWSGVTKLLFASLWWQTASIFDKAQPIGCRMIYENMIEILMEHQIRS